MAAERTRLKAVTYDGRVLYDVAADDVASAYDDLISKSDLTPEMRRAVERRQREEREPAAR